jgi:site-specific recombinase XerD
METVILKPLQHRGKECIGIYFKKNVAIQSLIQQHVGCRWSKTQRCWHMPLSKGDFEKLSLALKGHASLQADELRKYLLEKKKSIPADTAAPALNIQKNGLAYPAKEAFNSQAKTATSKLLSTLTEENRKAFLEYKNILVLKGYSPSTLRTYCNEFHIFLQTLKSHSAKELTPARLQRYILYCINILKLSENTVHSRMNALKFYYEQVLHKEKMFFQIPRPKKQHQLPKVFSQDEIAAIINSVKNKKHKAMLMLAYSAGLRVSEIVSIKTYQIDSKRMTIFISQAKGKKDRIVGLSPVLLVMLREYAQEYKPQKKGYLFEGTTSGDSYSIRSLQEVLQSAKTKAGILKPGGIHTLRHSFATHLIEKGTDVTMIQKLLGHNDLKTTMIYLHTTNKDLIKVLSPLDDLKLH